MARTRRRRPPATRPEPVAPPAAPPDLPDEVLAPPFEWPRPGGDQVAEGREVPGDLAQERPIRVDPPSPPARVRSPAGAEGPGALAVPAPPAVAPDRATPPMRGVRSGSGPGRIAGSSAGGEASGGAVDWLIRRVRGDDPRPSASPVDRDLPANFRELEPGQGWGLYLPPVRSVGEVPRLFPPLPPDRRGAVEEALGWLDPIIPAPGRVRGPGGFVIPYAPALPEGSPRFFDRNAGTPPSESLDELRGRQFRSLRRELLPGILGRSAGDPPRLIRPDASSRPMLPDELSLEQFERLRRRVMVEADVKRGIGSNRGLGGPPEAPPVPEGGLDGPGASSPALDGRSGVRTELDELLERLEALERGPRVGISLVGGMPGMEYRMG